MKSRCYNTKRSTYHHYGGRGIAVDDIWRNSYENFLVDMGRAPVTEDTWSVGRIDNNKNYGPENCKWEIWTEQARNRGMLINNTSGQTGVYFKLGSVGLGSWVATWHNLDGRRLTKGFTVLKYGHEAAKEMAIAYRVSSIESMNSLGAGYSEDHGIKRKIKESHE